MNENTTNYVDEWFLNSIEEIYKNSFSKFVSLFRSIREDAEHKTRVLLADSMNSLPVNLIEKFTRKLERIRMYDIINEIEVWKCQQLKQFMDYYTNMTESFIYDTVALY